MRTAGRGLAGAFARTFGTLPAQILGTLACLALFLMMLVTFVDVIGRYFFARPLPAGYELVSLLMPALIFCALPGVNMARGHVTIDLLDQWIPARVRQRQQRIAGVLSAAGLGVITWQLAMLSLSHYEFDGVTDELFLPLWPFSAAMAVLAALGATTMLVAALQVGRNDVDPAPRHAGPQA